MCDAGNNGTFEDMGERSMAGIMKKYCAENCLFFIVRYFNTFASQGPDSHVHQVQSTKAMLKPAVVRTRINEAGKAELLYISKPLKPLVFNKIKNEVPGNTNKSVNRIIYYLLLICIPDHLIIY
jgi:hypothetical protein